MKKFIKKNRKMIIISLAISFIIAYILGYTRTYKAFGGEDLLPIITAGYWLFRYLEEKESEEK